MVIRFSVLENCKVLLIRLLYSADVTAFCCSEVLVKCLSYLRWMWQNAYSIQIWLCKWQGFCIGVFGVAYQVLDYALKQCAVNSKSISFPTDSEVTWRMLFCRV